jgi:hypothetical protein
MAEQGKNPLQRLIDQVSGWKAGFEELRKRVGWLGAALLFLLAGGVLIWWNGPDIAKRPGVEWALALLKRKPLPTATTGRLTIAVAHLARDNERLEHELLLVDELQDKQKFEGFEVRRIDRTLDPVEEDEKKAEEAARVLLQKTGADVLIWGSVISLSLNEKSAMRLYWTMSREVSGAKSSGKYQVQTETLALSDEFLERPQTKFELADPIQVGSNHHRSS